MYTMARAPVVTIGDSTVLMPATFSLIPSRTACLPWLMLLLTGGLTGCSQQSNSRLSKGYHDLTAHYNALYIAENQLVLAEQALLTNRQDNYNQLLPILLPADSTRGQAVKAQLDDAIKMASVVADRHQNSRWLDNAYVVLGKARFYRQQVPEAIEIFKYVNTKGTDEADKHQALIGLMRCYVELNDEVNALNVAEYLRAQPLNDVNTRDYYLTKAHLHARNGQYAVAAALLDAAFPLLKSGPAITQPDAPRLHLIAGQLYDLVGQPAKAAGQYQAALRGKPTYDQSFYATIFLMQSDGNTTDAGKAAQANAAFARMLTDRKNDDLKDKIYYTMGLLEARRGNIDKALLNFRQSVATTTINTAQVPYTYLEMGRLYFEKKRDFQSARLYYDSSLALLPRESADYAAIASRKKTLDEFVTADRTIRLEDSLQTLTRLNPAELDNLLNAVLTRQDKEEAAKLALAEQVTGRPAGATMAGATNSNLSPDQRWVLYNPIQAGQGRQAFTQRWGNRPLEDNWRRTSKEASVAQAGDNNPLNGSTPANAVSPTNALQPGPPANAGVAAGNAGLRAGPIDSKKARKDALYITIPFTPDARDRSDKRLEAAYYSLGKLYKFQLNQPADAARTLETLLTRFPNTPNKPEVYYLLHVTKEQLGQALATYKNRLLTEFPNSSYARQLARAGQTPGQAANTDTEAIRAYADIYGIYEKGNITEALARTELALTTYAGTQVEDKLALLRLILTGRVKGRAAYAVALNEFVRDYPGSPLLNRVRELQAAMK
jgi:tetratricopeptide (TPR) repeat protein